MSNSDKLIERYTKDEQSERDKIANGIIQEIQVWINEQCMKFDSECLKQHIYFLQTRNLEQCLDIINSQYKDLIPENLKGAVAFKIAVYLELLDHKLGGDIDD